MTTITSAVIAKVAALNVEGKTVAQIAKSCKIKAAEVEQILAPAPVMASHYTSVATNEATAAGANYMVQTAPTQNELAALLNQAQAAPAQAEEKKERKARATTTLVKVAASSSKDAEGNSVQRRNTNCAQRAVAVFTSESENSTGGKICWLGTHLGFFTKNAAGAMKIMQTAPQKALEPMQKATDVVMVIEATDIGLGQDLELLKQQTYDKYAALGYTMLCRRAKVEGQVAPAAAPVETPVQEVKPEIEVAPETVVEPEAANA